MSHGEAFRQHCCITARQPKESLQLAIKPRGTNWAQKSKKGGRICIICIDMVSVKYIQPPHIVENTMPRSNSNNHKMTENQGALFFKGSLAFTLLCTNPASPGSCLPVSEDRSGFRSGSPYQSAPQYNDPCSQRNTISFPSVPVSGIPGSW